MIRFVHFPEAIDIFDILGQILNLLNFLRLVAPEQGIAGCCLKQDQHSILNYIDI